MIDRDELLVEVLAHVVAGVLIGCGLGLVYAVAQVTRWALS